MNDLISRQSAITALSNEIVKRRLLDEMYDGCIDEFLAEEILKKLPSAQPEIIRCKDCKHHWTYKCMDSMPIERCDLEQTFYDAEHDFCSLAERRTDA